MRPVEVSHTVDMLLEVFAIFPRLALRFSSGIDVLLVIRRGVPTITTLYA
jgi:hypothetical protein